jgi:hypothetical protein
MQAKFLKPGEASGRQKGLRFSLTAADVGVSYFDDRTAKRTPYENLESQ